MKDFSYKTALTDLLNIEFPLIVAPMFLVSNYEMVQAAMQAGVAGAFPSLNFREDGELEKVIDGLNESAKGLTGKGTYGINLIVQKTNPLYRKHLEICVAKKVPFYITSLGNPKEVIERAHAYGAKVFCDVTNLEHAKKCNDLGCDGFIAVGQGAGGHAGPNPLHLLVPSLKQSFPNTPVIGAGGIATGQGLASVLMLGAAGASVGTRFIATSEAGVNDAYKQAVVDSKMTDIVLTTKISGTPCTIINTPYAKKIGYKQNAIERFLSSNKQTRKYFKMWVQWSGMKKLEKSVMPANYKTLWCAGQSVELIDEVQSIADVIVKFKQELAEATRQFNRQVIQ